MVYDNVLSRASESIGMAVMPVCLTSLLVMVHYHVTSSELRPITMENIQKRPSIYCSLLAQTVAVVAMLWYWFFAMWLHWHEDTMHSWECYANGLLVAVFLTAYRFALYSSLILRVQESYTDKDFRASRCGLLLFIGALTLLSGANMAPILVIDGHAEEGICRYTVINKVLGILTDVSMGLASIWFFTKPVWALVRSRLNTVAKQLIVRQVVLNGILVVFSVFPWVVGIVQDAYLDERLVSPYVMASLHMNVSTFCLIGMYPASMKAGNTLIALCCCCGCVATDIAEVVDLRQAVTQTAKARRKNSRKNIKNKSVDVEEEEKKDDGDVLEMSEIAGTENASRKQSCSVPDSESTATRLYNNQRIIISEQL